MSAPTPTADVLLIGARGAVGSAIAERLSASGVSVTGAGRTPPPGGIGLSLGPGVGPAELRALGAAAAGHRLVINASGAETPVIARHLRGAQLLDISASAGYLAALAEQDPAAALVLGVGLAPGLTTMLLRALETAPGDELDAAIMLGSGEQHGPAAVAWTAGLLGSDLAEAAEGGRIRNLRERRAFPDGPASSGSRGYLRADFPDHTLLRLAGAEPAARVRSYLALSSRAMTASLAALARVPRLAGLFSVVPPLGDERWAITAVNRRTGEARRAEGRTQSRATAELTAATAMAALRRGPRPGVTLQSELLGLAAAAALPGITLRGPGDGAGRA